MRMILNNARMIGIIWFFLLLKDISQPLPSIYSFSFDSENRVCMLVGHSYTFRISTRDLRNIPKERERVLLLLASVGVAASNFPTSYSLVYIKYKSLINFLPRAHCSRVRSLT